MTRTNAREIACHLVYEMYLNDITAGEALTALMDEGYYPSLKSESDVYEEKPTGKQLEDVYKRQVIMVDYIVFVNNFLSFFGVQQN